MRRRFSLMPIFLAAVLVFSGCRATAEANTPGATEVALVPAPAAAAETAQSADVFEAQATAAEAPATPVVAITEAATATATIISPTPTMPPTATATDTPVDLALQPTDVQLHPVPAIFSGDRVTFQIQPHVPEEIPVSGVTVDIYVNDEIVTSDTLGWRNWAGDAEGVYQWVWDTSGMRGEQQVRVVLDAQDKLQQGDENPENNEAVFPVTVGRRDARPMSEWEATWITAETDCCTLHTVTGTAAYRDLGQLVDAVESAVSQAATQLNELPKQKIDVYFVERVIGQGGYAGSQMVVTYVDRQYAGGSLHELLVHEAVHVLDRQFAPQRTRFLAEGVAVWASGGHYKPEDLNERAAALRAIGRYLPLEAVIDDFYPVQHEIGYLQAAAFSNYLIENWGYGTYREFYSNTVADEGQTESEAIDEGLQSYYGATLAEMETAWLAYLDSLTPAEAAVEDLRTTIRFYDLMRLYQQQYDPTAHFLSAWLPHPAEVKEQGNTADFTRHPQEDVNIALETMLFAADEALRGQNYPLATALLDSVERVLKGNGTFVDPLSSSYLKIVQSARGRGYEAQQIRLQGGKATVLVTTAQGFHLSELHLELQRGDWVLSN